MALNPGECLRSGLLHDLGPGIQKVEDPAGCSNPLLDFNVHLVELADRRIEH